MKILAIRQARFGDVVLLLPALTALKAGLPNCHLTLLTGERCSPLAEMCPAIDDVISVNRIAMRDGPRRHAVRSIARLLKEVRRRRFDLVVDFHGFRETNLLAWLSGSPRRVGLKRYDQPCLTFCFNERLVPEDKSIHVREMFMRIADSIAAAPRSSGPALVVPENARRWAQQTFQDRSIVALYIDAPSVERIWPPERFAALADYVSEMLGADVVALAGPNGDHLIRRLLTSVRSSRTLHAFSNLGAAEVAAIIQASHLLVSNDTGPMHLGPALGTPTLGLFSIGIPEHFRPTGIHDRIVQGYPLETVQVEQVVVAVEEMWATAGPGPRR